MSLVVVGLGPGPEDWLTPEATRALAVATDLLGYKPYLDRLSLRPGQRVHASDNREELARARRLWRQPILGAGPKADDDKAHGRRPSPGTSTNAKYGAESSSFWASGVTTSLLMVARST